MAEFDDWMKKRIEWIENIINEKDALLDDNDFMKFIVPYSKRLTPIPNLVFQNSAILDILGCIKGPCLITFTNYVQKINFSAVIKSHQANQILLNRKKMRNTVKYMTRVIIRMGTKAHESNTIEDGFPDHFRLNINGKKISSYSTNISNNNNTFYKKKYLDITEALMPLKVNKRINFTLSWMKNNEHDFYIGIFLVRKLTCHQVAERIKNTSFRTIQESIQTIKNYFNTAGKEDLTQVKLFLKGFFTNELISLPCRFKSCTHISCFDLLKFIKKNEKLGRGFCYQCYKEGNFEDLVVDR